MDVAEKLAIDVRPIAGHIGAEVQGVDLTSPLDPPEVTAITRALAEWKVLFFRNQHITQAQHVAFGRLFGEVIPAHPTLPAAFPDHPEILLIDNQRNHSADELPLESRWHTDVSFTSEPPMGSILRGVVVPSHGGDTQWTNLAAAYRRLSPQIRDLIDGLHAVHQNLVPIARGDITDASPNARAFAAREIRAVHPVVSVHPTSGERILFVNPNFTTHVLELSRQESRHLLAMLFEHLSSAEFTCRFRWEADSIAFWDNRATAHLMPTDVPSGLHRSMQRITLVGGPTRGIDGSTSYSLDGGS